jgi:hypothetical protein
VFARHGYRIAGDRRHAADIIIATASKYGMGSHRNARHFDDQRRHQQTNRSFTRKAENAPCSCAVLLDLK